MNIDLASIESAASAADKVLDEIIRVEPTIAGIAGVFVPDVSLAQPYILAVLPALDKALEAVAAGNGGDMVGAVAEIFKHLLPGQPNSPILSAQPVMPKADTP